MLFFILQYIVYMLTYLLSGLYIPICIFPFCLAEFPRSPRRALRRDDRLLRPVVWRPRFPKKSCGKLHPNWGLHWMVNGWIKLVYIGLYWYDFMDIYWIYYILDIYWIYIGYIYIGYILDKYWIYWIYIYIYWIYIGYISIYWTYIGYIGYISIYWIYIGYIGYISIYWIYIYICICWFIVVLVVCYFC